MEQITNWLKKQLANPQIVFLSLFIIGLVLVISFTGETLAPVYAGIVMAYLLEGIISRFAKMRVPRMLAVFLVFAVFILCLAVIIVGLLPLLYNQLREVVQQVPQMLSEGQAALIRLPELYPDLFSAQQIQEVIEAIRTEITTAGQYIITQSVSSVTSVITVLIYVVLLPILIFFFLKDKDQILSWWQGLMPTQHDLAKRIWHDVDRQTGNYIRGKFWEILIVWVASFITFSWFELQFALLLSFLVGLSVLIPYVGAAVVTVPVAMIAWFQWGWSGDFAGLMAAYFVIQTLDGNLLVPWIFSEVVNIHPVAIIVAVLFFGGIWGVWGIFFAIPLATVVQAVMQAWPKPNEHPVVDG